MAKPELFKTGGRPRMQIGGQVGANINYFVYKNGMQKDESAGYEGGIFFRISRQMAFVQFEINFLRTSVNFKNGIFTTLLNNTIPFDVLKMKYHTVGIPLVFGAYAVQKPIFKLRFYTGIETTLIARTKVVLKQNDTYTFKLTRPEKRQIFRPAQFNYLLATGVDIAMFTIDFKYSVGMRSFFKEEYRTQTHLFQITVGAIF
jgi:hypothetical protein